MLQASSALPPQRPANAAQAASEAIAVLLSLCCADVLIARNDASGVKSLLTAPCCMAIILLQSKPICNDALLAAGTLLHGHHGANLEKMEGYLQRYVLPAENPAQGLSLFKKQAWRRTLGIKKS